MNQRDFDYLAEALKLTPEQKSHLAQVIARRHCNAEPAAEPPPPPRLNLHVHLMPGASLAGKPGAAQILTQDAKAVSPGFEAELARLSPELRAKLLKIEPQVLRWINASKQNALLFTTDPIAALRKAAPGLDEQAISQLVSIRANRPQARAAVPGVEIASITLDAKGAPPAPRREPQATAPRQKAATAAKTKATATSQKTKGGKGK
jgi:hypothetical protein